MTREPEVTLRIPRLEEFVPHPPGCRRYNLEIPFSHARAILQHILRQRRTNRASIPVASYSAFAVSIALDCFRSSGVESVPGLDKLETEIYVQELERFRDLAQKYGLPISIG